MTVKEYYRTQKMLNDNFFLLDEDFDVIRPYFTKVDNFIETFFSEREIFENDNNILYTISTALSNRLYEFDTLIKTLSFTYDPITNYDMTETEQTETGEQTTTVNSGEQANTTAYGEQKKTTENGSRTVNVDSKSNVSPYDASDYTPDTQNVNNQTEGAYTDTETVDGKTDTTTIGARVDSSLTGARSDTRTLTRKGNIGVMTTQDMIMSEREVALFTIIDKIAKCVINAVTYAIY